MFEPGDKVRIANTKGDFMPEELAKDWTIISYPWKCWGTKMVSIGDEGGLEKVVSVWDLMKIGEVPESAAPACNRDYCDL